MVIKCYQRIMKKIFNRVPSFIKKPLFFIVAAIVAFFILWIVNEYKDPNGFDWHDVIVESHGVFFDLLVFGIVLSLYEALSERKDNIQRLEEEIDDYRKWDEKEATYRIVGAIKRLQKLNIEKIDLSYCFLKEAMLKGMSLRKTDLSWANLSEADFYKANLQKAIIRNANLANANLWAASLQGANLDMADLQGANLFEAELQNATLRCANLKHTKLETANFQGANLQHANLQYANMLKANFKGADLQKANLYDADLRGANLEGASLSGANLSKLDLRGANLQRLNLRGINLRGANLCGTNFKGADLNEADLLHALVTINWPQSLETWQVKGREAIIEDYYIDENNTLQLRNPPTS